MIYVTGDTHGWIDMDKLSLENFPEQATMTKDDYVIIAGDFGLVFNNLMQELKFREVLASKNFTTLFVDGNHENFKTLDSLTTQMWKGGLVHFINDSIIHLCRGQVYDLDGVKIFTFGGADSIDKEVRTEGRSWWPREMPSDDEYKDGLDNLIRHDWEVDYIISHDCSVTMFYKLEEMVWEENGRNKLRDYLDILEEKVAFKHWFFGHYHNDIEIDEKHTLIFNNRVRIK